jgi:hypothetical protein
MRCLRRAEDFPGEAREASAVGDGPHPISAQRDSPNWNGSMLPSATGTSKAFIVMQMSV